MFSHVTVGTRNLEVSIGFYETLLAMLGWVRKFSDEQWAGWKPVDADRPLFIVTLPYDECQAAAGNGQMIAFAAPTRALVDRAYTTAISAGGTDEGTPMLRPQYHPDYYGAYVRDPDGNKLCICCHDPEPKVSAQPKY